MKTQKNQIENIEIHKRNGPYFDSQDNRFAVCYEIRFNSSSINELNSYVELKMPNQRFQRIGPKFFQIQTTERGISVSWETKTGKPIFSRNSAYMLAEAEALSIAKHSAKALGVERIVLTNWGRFRNEGVE